MELLVVSVVVIMLVILVNLVLLKLWVVSVGVFICRFEVIIGGWGLLGMVLWLIVMLILCSRFLVVWLFSGELCRLISIRWMLVLLLIIDILVLVILGVIS